jgi:hypothetical protein
MVSLIDFNDLYLSLVLTRSLVLDPVLKLEYLDATWDDKYIKMGMDAFKAQVLQYYTKYHGSY